jgi:hypothetical protein
MEFETGADVGEQYRPGAPCLEADDTVTLYRVGLEVGDGADAALLRAPGPNQEGVGVVAATGRLGAAYCSSTKTSPRGMRRSHPACSTMASSSSSLGSS